MTDEEKRMYAVGVFAALQVFALALSIFTLFAVLYAHGVF